MMIHETDNYEIVINTVYSIVSWTSIIFNFNKVTISDRKRDKNQYKQWTTTL